MAATSKKSRIQRLRESNEAFLTVQQEMKDFAELVELAEKSGNPGVIQKAKNTMSRYDVDFAYLASKRAYHLGKLIEESPTMFNEILNKVLA